MEQGYQELACCIGVDVAIKFISKGRKTEKIAFCVLFCSGSIYFYIILHSLIVVFWWIASFYCAIHMPLIVAVERGNHFFITLIVNPGTPSN